MPEPGQLCVTLDLAPAHKLLEAQRQGHEARDAWHPPRRDFRRGFNRTCIAKLRPADRQLWTVSLDHHAPRSQWPQAAAALARLLELDPGDASHWYNNAPLLLQLGDTDGYRRVCLEMLKRFGQSKEPTLAERTAKTCLLAPDGLGDNPVVMQLADRALAGTEKDPLYRCFVLAKGMAEYRVGRFTTAVAWLGESLSPGSEVTYLDATAYLLLSMAHHRLQQPGQARDAMAKARVVMEQKFPKTNSGLGADWSDWLRFQIIRREAEALVGLSLTPQTARK